MRRLLLTLSAFALAATTLPALASDDGLQLVDLPLGAGAFVSDNVEYLGTLPVTPGIGGRVLTVGAQQRLYMTGSQGLYIFDLSDPALPVPIGFYHLPHFQNEDVDVSEDGSRVVISSDTADASPAGVGTGVRVIDTSDPANPKHAGFIASGNHTTTCADAKCEWLYGSGGKIFDARDPRMITDTGKRWFQNGVTSSHALNRDASGLMISDSTPRLVLDVSDPANPKVLADGKPDTNKFGKDGLLQHNNVRPNAEQWVARTDAELLAPEYRPGEYFIGTPRATSTATARRPVACRPGACATSTGARRCARWTCSARSTARSSTATRRRTRSAAPGTGSPSATAC